MSSLTSEAGMGAREQPLKRSVVGSIVAVFKEFECTYRYTPLTVVVHSFAYLFTSEAIMGASEKPEPG